MMALDIYTLSAMIGSVIGFILAITGAGGAIIAIPLLMFSLHLSLHQAAPIALIAVFLASSIGAIQGLYQGQVRYKTAFLLATFGALTSPLGVVLSHKISNLLLSILFAGILLVVGFRMWQQSNSEAIDNSSNPAPACAINPATSKLFWTAPCTKRLVLTGSFAGLLSGLLGVGGGFVIIPSLYQVSNFSSQTIVATTLTVVALVSASSVLSYWHHSEIPISIALPFVFSTITVMLMMGGLRQRLPQRLNQQAFAILCILSAIYLAIKSSAYH